MWAWFKPKFNQKLNLSDLDKMKNWIDNFFNNKIKSWKLEENIFEDYKNYVNFLETAASAKIEWYQLTSNQHNKLSKLSKKH